MQQNQTPSQRGNPHHHHHFTSHQHLPNSSLMATPTTAGDDATTTPCDYCHHRIATVFCRADSAKLCVLCDHHVHSAKLCVLCDHHVHSANTLSGKHLRSQICDGCRSAPVAVRCSTDNLVLCRECDWDAPGVCSAPHDRTPVEGFTGTPSPVDLASNWGLDLPHHHCNHHHHRHQQLPETEERKNDGDPIHDSGHDLGRWANPIPHPYSWMRDLMVPEETK